MRPAAGMMNFIFGQMAGIYVLVPMAISLRGECTVHYNSIAIDWLLNASPIYSIMCFVYVIFALY